MPNWKKVIVSGSDAHLNSVTASAAQLTGLSEQAYTRVLVSDTNGNIAYTGSGAFGGGGGGGMTWNEVTGTSQTMASNNGYIANNASLVTLTLPSSPTLGDEVAVAGKGAGGWKIAQPAGDQIHFGEFSTTVGTGGSLEFTQRYDMVELLYIGSDQWVVRNSVGSIKVD